MNSSSATSRNNENETLLIARAVRALAKTQWRETGKIAAPQTLPEEGEKMCANLILNNTVAPLCFPVGPLVEALPPRMGSLTESCDAESTLKREMKLLKTETHLRITNRSNFLFGTRTSTARSSVEEF